MHAGIHIDIEASMQANIHTYTYSHRSMCRLAVTYAGKYAWSHSGKQKNRQASKHAVIVTYMQADSHTDKHYYRQAGKQTRMQVKVIQTGRESLQAIRQTSVQVDRHPGGQVYRKTYMWSFRQVRR